MVLRNGADLPDIGLGTWKLPHGEVCERAVFEAIKLGYRHIDTAAVYGNEKSVGDGVRLALREGLIKDRAEIFITSKVWNSHRSGTKVIKAFEKTAENLDLDYVDLYLIHWPANRRKYKDPEAVNRESWEAMQKLYDEKKVRAIGVSNFMPHHIESLKRSATVMPMVNQIEVHIGFMQDEARAYNEKEGIVTEAYSPLGTGDLLDHESLKEMGRKYGISTAGICLSYLSAKNVVLLPKSKDPKRMEENLRWKDVPLQEEDIKTLDALPFIGGHGYDPDEVEF